MSPPSRRQMVGRWGEQLAVDFLETKGYRILARNYHTRYGEIDLVALKGEITIFVEVKTRSDTGFGLPEESVTAAKRAHLLQAIQLYWQEAGSEGAWQVDVIAILGRQDGKAVQIEHFENALTE